MRPGETLKLHKEDFHLDRKNRYIILKGTKTKKYDKVTIPNEGVKPIMKWLQTKPNGKLWNIKYHGYLKWLKKLGYANDIEAWTTPQSETGEKTYGHIGRKSMGKDMMLGHYGEKAEKIPIISKHLRHQKVSTTTDYYLRMGDREVFDAI